MMLRAFIIALCVVSAAWGACHFTPREASGKDDDMSCAHPDYDGVTIDLGGNFLSPDCYNITCTEGGLYTCGFGWKLASVMALPADCESVRVEQCGVRFVKKDDADTPCFEDDSFNSIDSPI